MQLETNRLILRPWKDSDLEPFAALNADPDVMEFFPKLMTLEESSAMVDRVKARYEADGFCFWALKRRKRANSLGS